ncbi:pyrroline-5-carboxylate reductase [Desulfolucanica intricata]|uniref:pyrroline-5-carboxylate reductase n=1 Tax=Desulfolucanica intricata TaxID=1285191 RepID=UPI000830903C|nr:pyrroline-5-carboxylate reductase [Desulfolucanica intricata]
MLAGQKIGFLGGGAMAEALITGIVKSELVPVSKIFVSDINRNRLVYLQKKLGVNLVNDNRSLVQESDIIFLAVKPFVVEKILNDVEGIINNTKIIISIAAGITTGCIEGLLKGKQVPVVRVMPNTPALVGEGASALSLGKYSGAIEEQKAAALMSAVGKVVSLPESLLDSVTGLSGSGPAYMYIVLEALSDAGVRMGLPRNVATLLSAQTMIGAARMVLETGEHPGSLKDQVTTPGGTTIAGLYTLEEAGVRAALMRAVETATKRSRELSGS